MSTTRVGEMATEVGSADSSRRDFLKKAAVVAWSAPVIMTVTAQRASANHLPGTCRHSGVACNTSTTTYPTNPCCATAGPPQPTGATLVCCTTGPNTGKCGTPSHVGNGPSLPANMCTVSSQCCSGKCVKQGNDFRCEA